MPEPTEQIARLADRARGELLATIRELDRRRRLALDLKYQAQRHFSWVLLFAAASVVGVGAATVLAATRWRHRRARVRRERIKGLVRAWKHPQRIANERGVTGGLIAKATAALAAEQLAKFALEQLQSAQRAKRRLRERGNGRMPSHLPTERAETV